MSATNEDRTGNDETNEQQENQEDQQEHNTGEDARQVEDTGEQAAAQDTRDHEEQAGDENPTDGNEQEQAREKAQEKPEEAEAPEDLFDLMGDAGKEHKKKKPEPAKQAAGNAAGSAAKKPEPKVFPSGSTVVYSGHKIELEEEMTGEQLIQFLEDDFPELTKDTTEFTHDEARGRIVPTRKALKKGAVRSSGPHSATDERTKRGSSREPRTIQVDTELGEFRSGPIPPVKRVLTHDGVYEVRNTRLGSFIARIPSTLDLGLREGAYLKIPKAPVSLLERTLQIFKERPDREALATIVYNHRDQRHHLVWVPQTATATSIDYDPVPETEYLTTFCEIHSHNTMRAFFSATDDGSEVKSTGLYGVVGRVDRERPCAAFRFSCGTHFRPLHAEDLFEEPERISKLISECGP